MTTEIWVTRFRQETLISIPDNGVLSSVQKTKLIQDLNKYFPPPSNYCNTKPLSITQFGRIYDQVDKTSISTTSFVSISNQESPDIKLRTSTGSWRYPVIISQDKEIAGIILPGYKKISPISIQNVSQPLL